jgi:hypothetical protein
VTTPPFKKGQRIRLLRMPDDPDPIPPGTTGTIGDEPFEIRPGVWSAMVKWDIPRSLSIVVPPDVVQVLP